MRAHYRMSWLALNLVERVVFGFRVSGRERIPRTGAVIIASNHISYADPPVVGSAVPREVHFLAKEELFANKPFGWLIGRYNAIALKRAVGDIGAVRKALDLLRDGKAVLMFPEGTRSLGGKLLKPRPGVGLIACMANVPVVPTYVTGTDRLGQALLRKAPLCVRFGPPVSGGNLAETCATDRERYQKLADEVMKRIADLAQEAEREAA